MIVKNNLTWRNELHQLDSDRLIWRQEVKKDDGHLQYYSSYVSGSTDNVPYSLILN